jgi:hypothetical protein
MAERLKDAVRIIKQAIQPLDGPSLHLLYQQYTARFLSDNNRIWLTGSIMIPLALSGFALVPTIQHPSFMRLLPVAIVSVTILLVWNAISDHHRQFQDKSMAWMLAIEELLIERGGRTHPGLVKVGRPRLSVRTWRWLLLVVVGIAWLIVLFVQEWWRPG